MKNSLLAVFAIVVVGCGSAAGADPVEPSPVDVAAGVAEVDDLGPTGADDLAEPVELDLADHSPAEDSATEPEQSGVAGAEGALGDGSGEEAEPVAADDDQQIAQPTPEPAASATARPDEVDPALRDWLTEDGRVRLEVDEVVEAAQSEAVGALCDYVFGSVAEVTVRAKLWSTTEFLDQSVLVPSAGGGFLLCAYGANGHHFAALEVGHSEDSWSNGITTLVREGDIQAVLSYVPDYAGKTLGKKKAQRWLREALRAVE